jgi:ATP-dependent Clp protease ATP-binding subunit ClpA
VATQLAKTCPARPGSVMLLGPTGSGKTTTVEALPRALCSLGHRGAHLHRVDCSELTEPIQQTRLLGSPPGYVGYVSEPPLFTALARTGCILLLDEVEKAHPEIVEDAFLNLLDAGRLMKPQGGQVDAAHAVIALTTNLAADALASRLHRVAPENRWAVQQACREVLVEEGLPPELVGRIGAFAVYRPLGADAMRAAATGAIRAVAAEYGMTAAEIDPVLAEVVVDIAGETQLGARALHHAAAELLGEALADAASEGLTGAVAFEPGPPPRVVPAAVRG